jgi:DNA polymerase III epsilon subunit-like protein
MKYVSIDIETTGLEWEKHQMIEFGAVLEDTENPLPIEDLPRLRILVVHEDYVSNPYCIKLHSKLFDELGKYTDIYTPTEVECGVWVVPHGPSGLARVFTQWLKKVGYLKRDDLGTTSPKKVVVAGKNYNGFDAKFLEYYFNYRIAIHHRVLDPMPLFVKPEDKTPPNLAECAKRAGVEFKGTGYHTAVSDATMVIELLRAGWNR